MIDAISSALATNQLLAGGVGTLAFGAVMYLLRAVPEKLVEIAGRTLWTKLFVESLSNEYRDIDGFIAQRRLDFFSRSLEIKDGALKTGFGGGFGVYDGVLFKYSKAKAAQQIAPFETIAVSFLTRDRGVVARFLEDCKPEEHRNSLTVTIYTVGGSAGHSGLWGLNIDEGTRQKDGGRRWDVEVISAAGAYAQRAEVADERTEERKQHQQQTRDEKQREAILNALRLYPDGETPRVIREMAALSGAVATRHLSMLIAEGLVEECLVKKHTREERGVRLRGQALSA